MKIVNQIGKALLVISGLSFLSMGFALIVTIHSPIGYKLLTKTDLSYWTLFSISGLIISVFLGLIANIKSIIEFIKD
jgi:hypothetical protein